MVPWEIPHGESPWGIPHGGMTHGESPMGTPFGGIPHGESPMGIRSHPELQGDHNSRGNPPWRNSPMGE